MRKLSLFITVALFVAPFPAPLRAAFILDDFDDAASTLIQTGLPLNSVTTENVGALKAKRDMIMIGRRGDPVGSFDANVSRPSTLTSIVSSLNQGPTQDTDVFVWWDYEFPSTDLTQAGRNDAFLFDFRELKSEMPPSRLLITIDPGFYVHQHFSMPLNSNPFTIFIPFHSFATRGGSPWDPATAWIASIHIEIRPTLIGGGGPDPLNFHMELDRIRIGQIPEPSTFGLLLLGNWIATTRRSRAQ